MEQTVASGVALRILYMTLVPARCITIPTPPPPARPMPRDSAELSSARRTIFCGEGYLCLGGSGDLSRLGDAGGSSSVVCIGASGMVVMGGSGSLCVEAVG